MPTLVPVDHDPFAAAPAPAGMAGRTGNVDISFANEAPPSPKLVPVDYDPFAASPGPMKGQFDQAFAPTEKPSPEMNDKVLQAAAPGGLASGGLGALDMASLGFSDEAAGLISATVKKLGGDPGAFWDNYTQTRDEVRQNLDLAQTAHPVAYTAGQVGGGLATALIPGGAVGRSLSAATNALKIGKTGKSVVTGGVMGGAYGAGSADGDAGDRLEGVAWGAPTGGAIGAVASPIATGVGKVVGSIASKVTDRSAAKELGVPTGAVSSVRGAVADDIATKSLRAPNEGDMLMNLGPQLGRDAEGIATQTGRGSNILLDASKRQAAAEGGRIEAVVDRTLGKDAGRVVDKAAVEAERKAAGRLYDAARKTAQPVYIGDIRNALDTAIAESDGAIRARLERLRSLRAFADPKTGTPLYRSAVDLHAARMEIDDAIRDAGLGTNAARLLGHVRDAVDDTLKKSAKGYGAADTAYTAAIKGRDALQEGRQVFTRAFGSPDELRAELVKMTPEIRARFLKGARDAISVLMGTSRNEAAAVRRELMQKGWNKEKLEILVGKQTAQVIDNALEGSANRAAGREALAANSRTAMRASAQKRYPGEVSAAEVGDKVRSTSLSGAGLAILVAIANKASGGVITKAINSSREKTAEGAAKLLASTGSTRDKVLRVIAEAERKTGRALNAKEQIEAVTRAFTVPAATAGGVRALSSGRTE